MRTFKNPSRQPKLIPLRSGTISVPGRATFEIRDDDYSVQIGAMVARCEIYEEVPTVIGDPVGAPAVASVPPSHTSEAQIETRDISPMTTDRDESIGATDSAEDLVDADTANAEAHPNFVIADVAYADPMGDSGDADSLTIDENRGELEEGKDIVDDSIKEPDVRLGRKAKKKRRG